MATLGGLKARIADEILKRNLTSQIASAITSAIGFYADRRWWFNGGTREFAVTSGDQYTALTGVRQIDKVWVEGELLDRVDESRIEGWYARDSAATGAPHSYAWVGDELRFYPEPDDAYGMVIEGVFDVLPALSSDASSNAWTTEAEDLIAARARYTLYRDVLRNTEQAAITETAVREALDQLIAKNNRRLSSGRVRGHL
jgi:hypothetical protein